MNTHTIECIIASIKVLKKNLRKINCDYNSHYFRSYGKTGCYKELCKERGEYRTYLSLAKKSKSLHEFKERVREVFGEEKFWYNRHGEDSLYFAYELKNGVRVIRRELLLEESKYKASLDMVKETKRPIPL